MFKLRREGVAVLGAGRAVEVTGKGFHKKGDEVALAEEDVVFHSLKVVEEVELGVHKGHESSHGGFVGFIDP